MAPRRAKPSAQDYDNWFDRMAGWFERRVKQKIDPRTREEFDEHAKLFRTLSHKDTPSLALGSFENQLLNSTFNLRLGAVNGPNWALRHEDLVCKPVVLSRVLDDFQAAVGNSQENEALIRTRLSAILLLTLADEKRPASSHSNSVPPIVAQNIQGVFWGFEKQIAKKINYKNAHHNLNGFLDYCLWWGSPDDLETNLVVVEAKASGHASAGRCQALVSMAMIHTARKQAGKRDCQVFGIGTDSYEFNFITIDNNSEYSWVNLFWSTEASQIAIVSQITRIMRHAAALAPTSTRHSNVSATSVSQLTGCTITNVATEDGDE
ncbi:hypothetical protein BJX76DRAFT_354125 [Aspergillus varians]